MSESPTAPLKTADGVPLKTSLRRAVRRSKLKALLLVSPLLAFLIIAFVMPLFDMLWRSVDNPEVSTALPQTSQALADWDGESLPDEPAFAASRERLSRAVAGVGGRAAGGGGGARGGGGGGAGGAPASAGGTAQNSLEEIFRNLK